MRVPALVAGAALSCFACKSRATPTPAAPTLPARAPVVTSPASLLTPDLRAPRVLVLIAADGSIVVADAPSGPDAWTVMSSRPPRKEGTPVPLERLGPVVMEAVALGTSVEARAAADDDAPAARRAAPDEVPPPEPPPPPEEKADEGEDESGGTGTTVMLEEGTMGRRDPDRAEGPYRMKRGDDAPPLPRRPGPDADPPDPRWPARQAVVAGAVLNVPGERDTETLVIAAPGARATALIDTLAPLRGALLGVNHQGSLRALRVGFGPRRDAGLLDDEGSRWREVRIGAAGLELERVPGPVTTVPWTAGGGVDAAALARAFPALAGEAADVDLLVAADTDVQRTIDVLVALDAAGARGLSLGRAPAPGSAEAGKRGRSIPSVRLGQPQVRGDLDRAVIRRGVRGLLPELERCYQEALARTPDLSGTVQTRFVVTPTGSLTSVEATGVEPALGACVVARLERLELPGPRGGGVLVQYPLVVRP